MSVDELLALQKKLLMASYALYTCTWVLPLPSEQSFDQKLEAVVKNIPILIGWTAHDGRPFASTMGPQGLQHLPIIGSYLESLGTWYITFSYFKRPSQRFYEQVLRARGISTAYSFNLGATENPLGACHSIDIPFVLGNWEAWQHPLCWWKRIQKTLSRNWELPLKIFGMILQMEGAWDLGTLK
ncbi:hypothetical protein N7526_010985 [Penicillium atrosanguineum]|nr:hypothetical protein N7526_010985 [Penicillium atrosanguineum]